MKLAILGSKNSVLGFKAIGLDVFSNLKNIDLENYGILFITEDWAKKLRKEIDEISSQALPAILTVPSMQGASKEGIRNLKKIVEKAIGSDILKLEN
ncbi:MAG: V-type ATP synthase subunit F [bacterium]